MKTKRWQDWFNLLLGAWLFASPWVMAYEEAMLAASWNAYIVGTAIMLFATYAVSIPKAWEEALNIALGAWLAVSPWALGFAYRDVAMNTTLVGVAVLSLAVWAMLRDRGFQDWWHTHHPL